MVNISRQLEKAIKGAETEDLSSPEYQAVQRAFTNLEIAKNTADNSPTHQKLNILESIHNRANKVKGSWIWIFSLAASPLGLKTSEVVADHLPKISQVNLDQPDLGRITTYAFLQFAALIAPAMVGGFVGYFAGRSEANKFIEAETARQNITF